MDELGFEIAEGLPWFSHERETPYVLVRVAEEYADNWAEQIRDAFRRCYVTDDLLQQRTQELRQELGGTPIELQKQIIHSKLPDAGPIMSGDFGEILVYFYHAVTSHPQVAFGPKKWRLKETRTKAAPYSDVLHFILPSWPTSTADDLIFCSEVKSKATDSEKWSPIDRAIEGCSTDRISRLAKTLVWLRDRAIGENLGSVRIEHLNRFINANDHPAAIKRFYAVAVICSSLLEAELDKAPVVASADYTLVVIAVPNLHATYTAVFEAVRESNLFEVQGL
jgi:hypothetical protein